MSIDTGFILINKPSGPTSHNIINRLRKITGIKRIGHAGTLDPFASGLLIVGVGRESTKQLGKFLKMDKEYTAAIRLGIETDTYDKEGKIIKRYELSDIKREDIEKNLGSFLGKQQQIPPMFSAKKINGKKLYELARMGLEVERKPVDIEIYKIELLEYNFPILKIHVKCSSGTYIRSLGFDIGRRLGIGACLEELERTKIGEMSVKNAINTEKLDGENWRDHLVDISN